MQSPSVQILARARIGTLRFTSSPRAHAAVGGCGVAEPIDVTIRENLPAPVEPGTTYHDVDVAIEIRTSLRVLCSGALQSLLRADATGDGAGRLRRLCAASPEPARDGRPE
jgi:hypothetical protein